jgi:WD40 repeat protein
MRRERDKDLERRLQDLPLPDEAEAEERSWEVVRTAYAERTPVRPTYRARRFALAAAVGAVLLAIGLSPAGAEMTDWVRDVVGEEDAKPELTSLPTGGELLVEADGVWIVRADGSQRRLGDYDEASWSPNGLFVVATDQSFLYALDPAGEVRWKVPARNAHDPRWGGTDDDTRIAYRSEGDLWVVAGDGTDKRLIARNVAPAAPVWRPLVPEEKLQGAPESVEAISPPHLLSYVAHGRPHTVDVDTARRVRTTKADFKRLSAPSVGSSDGQATSPDGRRVARILYDRSGGAIVRLDMSGRKPQTIFSGPGHLTGPSWSPDGRWILIGWREANQWLFIRTDHVCLDRPDRPGCLKAIGDIPDQFESGDDGAAFPRVSGWILPAR